MTAVVHNYSLARGVPSTSHRVYVSIVPTKLSEVRPTRRLRSTEPLSGINGRLYGGSSSPPPLGVLNRRVCYATRMVESGSEAAALDDTEETH